MAPRVDPTTVSSTFNLIESRHSSFGGGEYVGAEEIVGTGSVGSIVGAELDVGNNVASVGAVGEAVKFAGNGGIVGESI